MTTLQNECVKPRKVFFDAHLPCVNFTYKKAKFCLRWTTPECVSYFFKEEKTAQPILNEIKEGCETLLVNPKNYIDGYHTTHGILEYGFHQ